MTVRLFAACLVALFIVPTTVPKEGAAKDLVVDNVRGNDSQNDRGLVAGPASFGPYRSINRALAAAFPGDRIILVNTGKPYRECISLVGFDHSGSPSRPFEIVGNNATLDGSRSPSYDDWRPVRDDIWQLITTPPGHGILTLDGNALKNKPLDSGTSLSELEPLSWTRVGPRIYFCCERNRGPFDYSLEVSDQTTGITLYDVSNVVIRDLNVRGYRIDGINAHDRVSGAVLLNVRSFQNGRSGITVAGASEMSIRQTVAEQNGMSQLRVEGRGAARLIDTKLDESLGKAIVKVDAGVVFRP
jgi:hypothetical protein